MYTRVITIPILFLSFITYCQPIIFEEINGIVAVEAEHFHEIVDNNVPRTWYLISDKHEPLNIEHDPDVNHSEGSSGIGYMEVLPDTRVTHDDILKKGINFFPRPGQGAYLSYKVFFNDTGRYYVWCRAFSTGTEDNGLHAGMNGHWPENGARIQWCSGKNKWTWSSAQRVPDNHCGENFSIYLDVEKRGIHTISFSTREDGMEFDKWIMTKDSTYIPEGRGIEERLFCQ